MSVNHLTPTPYLERHMKPLLALALFGLCLTVVAAEKPAVVPKIKLGKDTTYITEPLDADGYINYERALNERAKGKTTPETNAVVLHWELLGAEHEMLKNLPDDYFKELGIPRPTAKTLKRKRFIPSDWFFTALRVEGNLDKPTLTEEELAVLDLVGRRPWSPKQYPVVAEWIVENREAFATLDEACRRSGYYSPIISRTADGKRGLMIGSHLPTVQFMRMLTQALRIRAMLYLHEGNASAAYADGLTLHRLARQVAQGETLIDSMVAVAVEVLVCETDYVFLANTTPNAPEFLAYRTAVAALPKFPLLADKLNRFERFMMLDSLQHLRRQGVDGLKTLKFENTSPSEKPSKAACAALDKLEWEPAFQLANQWYDREVVALNRPTQAERRIALQAFEKELAELTNGLEAQIDPQNFESLPKDFPLTIAKAALKIMVPRCERLQRSQTCVEQQQLHVEIAIALANYHATYRQYPKTLSALVPKYLANEPKDLLTQKPLNYARIADGYRFYSVGMNLIDDGGTADDRTVEMPLPKLE